MHGGTRVGRCRNVELSFERQPLETTKQGDLDATFIGGLRRGSGQAVLIYDPSDEKASNLINNIFNENIANVTRLKMILGAGSSEYIELNAVITSVSMSLAYGDAMTCSIAFNVTGKYIDGGL
jgi:hypothetical protein